MSGMHAAGVPSIGDLRGTVRLLQHKLNAVDHVCAEAEATTGVIRADLLRAALNGRHEL
jgi:hypothetical protein